MGLIRKARDEANLCQRRTVCFAQVGCRNLDSGFCNKPRE
jgi:hypothetical protein